LTSTKSWCWSGNFSVWMEAWKNWEKNLGGKLLIVSHPHGIFQLLTFIASEKKYSSFRHKILFSPLLKNSKFFLHFFISLKIYSTIADQPYTRGLPPPLSSSNNSNPSFSSVSPSFRNLIFGIYSAYFFNENR
jgi:hypothetical protein